MRVKVVEVVAGERGYDGGEYGFSTRYTPETGMVRREYLTTADFGYCAAAGRFEDSASRCLHCEDEEGHYDGLLLTPEEAGREIAETTREHERVEVEGGIQFWPSLR